MPTPRSLEGRGPGGFASHHALTPRPLPCSSCLCCGCAAASNLRRGAHWPSPSSTHRWAAGRRCGRSGIRCDACFWWLCCRFTPPTTCSQRGLAHNAYISRPVAGYGSPLCYHEPQLRRTWLTPDQTLLPKLHFFTPSFPFSIETVDQRRGLFALTILPTSTRTATLLLPPIPSAPPLPCSVRRAMATAMSSATHAQETAATTANQALKRAMSAKAPASSTTNDALPLPSASVGCTPWQPEAGLWARWLGDQGSLGMSSTRLPYAYSPACSYCPCLRATKHSWQMQCILAYSRQQQHPFRGSPEFPFLALCIC